VAFELERPWALSPQVSLRPERFGALAYHFGTRRLSFLKSPRLLCVVESLAREPSALAACRRAGVPEAQLAEYERALATLADTDMIRPRPAGEIAPAGDVAPARETAPAGGNAPPAGDIGPRP
jgi:putative mycofactocin binding protein MftB